MRLYISADCELVWADNFGFEGLDRKGILECDEIEVFGYGDKLLNVRW